MTLRFTLGAGLLVAMSGQALAKSGPSPNAAPPPPPRVAPARPAMPAADMQAVLAHLPRLGSKPVERLTPVKARINPAFPDALHAEMRRRGLPTAPDPSVTTMDLAYGADPMQVARIYKPARAGREPMPLIVYFHGGGWVIADINAYDATPRMLSKELGAIVVSVEYRKAPEAKFPAQHEDAAMAYHWVLDHAREWGADRDRIAFAGESAGGNLAVATAIWARDNRAPMPGHILAVYPIANSSMTLPSRRDSANAKPLNTAMLGWFGHYYSRRKADQMDPRINLVAADLRGLPGVTIVNAQIDPLRSDGETLATAMRGAGVSVEQRTFQGVTHEFFGMGKVVRGAKQAEDYAVARLRNALDRR